jgi:hypothetical protein
VTIDLGNLETQVPWACILRVNAQGAVVPVGANQILIMAARQVMAERPPASG